jgi:hypothetical protein
MQRYGIRANTSWLRIRIMCPSQATCLLWNVVLNSELAQLEIQLILLVLCKAYIIIIIISPNGTCSCRGIAEK